MCGLFGFIGESPNPEILIRVAILSETRGPHAFGFAWVDNDKIKVHKQPGKISENLEKLAVLKGASIIIGQSRMATSGDWLDNKNNQPLSLGKLAMSYNGNVYNAQELFNQYSYQPQTNNDTEAVLAGALTVGIEEAIKTVDPRSPMAVLFIDRDKIFTIRKGHPLYFSSRSEGVYFCSRKINSESILLTENEAKIYD